MKTYLSPFYSFRYNSTHRGYHRIDVMGNKDRRWSEETTGAMAAYDSSSSLVVEGKWCVSMVFRPSPLCTLSPLYTLSLIYLSVFHFGTWAFTVRWMWHRQMFAFFGSLGFLVELCCYGNVSLHMRYADSHYHFSTFHSIPSAVQSSFCCITCVLNSGTGC